MGNNLKMPLNGNWKGGALGAEKQFFAPPPLIKSLFSQIINYRWIFFSSCNWFLPRARRQLTFPKTVFFIQVLTIGGTWKKKSCGGGWAQIPKNNFRTCKMGPSPFFPSLFFEPSRVPKGKGGHRFGFRSGGFFFGSQRGPLKLIFHFSRKILSKSLVLKIEMGKHNAPSGAKFLGFDYQEGGEKQPFFWNYRGPRKKKGVKFLRSPWGFKTEPFQISP